MDSDAKQIYQSIMSLFPQGLFVASTTHTVELFEPLEVEATKLQQFFITQGLHVQIDLIREYLQINQKSIPVDLDFFSNIKEEKNYQLEFSQIAFDIKKQSALLEIYEYSGEFFTNSYLYMEKNVNTGEWHIAKKILHRLN